MLVVAAGACGKTQSPGVPPPRDVEPPRVEADGGAGDADAATRAAVADAASDAARAADGPADMLLVPGGTFTMGADAKGEEDEHPAHAVTLASFWLDRTEVTQAAYAECVTAGACPPPDAGTLEKFGGAFKGPNRPVSGVSWFDARAYCKYRGKRLPREAEFERAVRGADGRLYPWGSEPPTPERAVFHTSVTADVGSKPAGKGPYGHDDLTGNVWEWIDDDYDPFAYKRPGAAKGEPGSCAEITQAQDSLRREGKQGYTGTNPIPTECEKAIRGGAYNYDAWGLRATNRVHHAPTFKLLMTGMRCAKDAG